MSRVQIAAVFGAAVLLAGQGATAAPFEFAGFYAGGHFGYMKAEADVDTAIDSSHLSDWGTMGGLQAGYNFVRGSIMYGIETDVSLSNADPEGGCGAAGAGCDIDTGPMGTFRGRVGFATGDFLLFATGGVAAGRFDVRTTDAQGNGFDDLETFGKFGWTAGAGVEYLVGDMMSVKLEYRYTEYFQADYESFNGRLPTVDTNFHTFMGGVNWHF